MATVNIGKIKLKWRGTYAGGTAYTPDDVVEYTDGSVTSTYICVTESTGNAPSSGGTAHSSWNYMAKGQAPSATTTRGDIIFRGASADQRLAAGTSGYFLKTLGSSADPVWAEVSTSGKVLGITELVNNTRTSRGSSATNYDIVTGSYTQVKASSKIFWWAQCWWRGNYSGEIRYQLLYAGAEKNIGQSGYHFSNHSHRFGGHGNGMFTGDGSTGSKTIVWRESAANGGSHRSGSVHNPNASDNDRLSQHASNVTIWEVDI